MGLKFCQLASISLVCQPCTSQPLTLPLPHPFMAWVSGFPGWGLAVREVQLRDSGDSNLACDAAVSQEDAAPIAPAELNKSKFMCFVLFFLLPSLLSSLIVSLIAVPLPPLLIITYPLLLPAISWSYQPISPPSLFEVQSVFIHLSSSD